MLVLAMSLRILTVATLLVTSALLIAPAATADDPVPAVCPPASDPDPLSVGVAVLGNDASAATPAADIPTGDCFFSFQLPGGVAANEGKELLVSVTGAESHQIFVKRGTSPASVAPFTCIGTAAASSSCRVYWPLTQPEYSIRVARTAAGAGDFSISVSIVAAPASGCPHGYSILPLALGAAQSITLGVAAGSRCYFSFVPAPGDDVARAVATGLPSLAGSYVIAKGGDVPLPATSVPGTATSGDYGCTLPSSGTTRTCGGPAIGEPWYIVLVRASAVASATPFGLTASSLIACSLGSGTIEVALDTPITGSVDGSAAAQSCKFHRDVSSQSESLTKWVVTPSGANVDNYIRVGAPIAAGVFDCGAAATGVTTADVCSVHVGDSNDAYGLVYRPAAGAAGSFSLVVSAVEGCPGLGGAIIPLAAELAVAGGLTDDVGAACRFSFAPDPDEATVRISVAVTSASGTESLLVRRGAEPTATSFDCSATATASSPAVCDLENLGDQIFVRLRRTTLASSFSITALAFSPCSLGGGDTVLGLGLPQVGALTDADGGACRFKVDVPSSSDGVQVDLAPSSGDFDLYLKKGSRPTTASFDCKSSTLGAGLAESCLSVFDAGTYFALVQRVSGSGDFSLVAAPISSCSGGTAPIALAKGVAASASLLDAAGAKCFFAFTPGAPLADPFNPADDVVKFELQQDAADNFDLFVRRAVVPSTATRDCQSILAAGAIDACELVVPDGSVYYAMVRRTSGSGDFSIKATTSSSCALGPGYHQLPNGIEVQSSTRAVAGSTKCYFSLPSLARDDLLSIVQEAKTANTGYTVTLTRDVPVGSGPAACSASSSWISIPSLGLNLVTLAQCDVLLEDGLPHQWYVSVARTATAGAANITFAIKGTAQTIPTLLPGVPQVGHVDTGGVQYWKVVLPENATFLDIQTAGDVSNLACALGSQANSLVATACLLLPFPKLVGCALAAGYGVSCDQAELTLAERCVAETGDAATCAQIEAARLEACAAVNSVNPGACLPSDTSGSVSGTCGIINRQTGDNTCDPLGASVKTTEMDLLVRHRAGLPSSSAYDCRSAGPGALERCLFSDDVKEVHDNTTEPVRGDLNEAIANLTSIVAGNRTALDEALAELKAAIAENRTTVIEPLWAMVRDLVFSSTGQDPGPLPATPGIPAVPVIGAPPIPDQTNALPLPGPGKYFIAVRGPLDLASSLYYQGGDYAIVALHDDIRAPSQDDLDAQKAALLERLEQGIRAQCVALAAPCDVVIGAVIGACITATGGDPACSDLDGLLTGSPADVCEAAYQIGPSCDRIFGWLTGSTQETCNDLTHDWWVCDYGFSVIGAVLAIVDGVVSTVLDLLPPLEPPSGLPELPDGLPELPPAPGVPEGIPELPELPGIPPL